MDWQTIAVFLAAGAGIAAAVIAYRASIRAVEVSAQKGLEQWKPQSAQERGRWAWEAQQSSAAWQREEDRRHRQAGEDAARKVRDLLLSASAQFDYRHQSERRARWKIQDARIRHLGLAGPEREELDPLLGPVPNLAGEIPDEALRAFVGQAATVLEQWEPASEQLDDVKRVGDIGWRVGRAVQDQLGAFIRGETPTRRDASGSSRLRSASTSGGRFSPIRIERTPRSDFGGSSRRKRKA